ncbi:MULTISPECIES: dolichyl-phosphate beta-glucosyltransferase [unclassified Streptomyces]|uniref:dolichyl-phosphate beta-glucosyltransferase n=1 Tax=unclassified Streptomyces TaxID=2593676 RepID=UPI003D8A3435
MDLEVVIPARNEERRLPATISATIDHLASRGWSSAIVVVDNGSVDHTAEIIEQFQNPAVKIYVIGCSERGKGAAVRRGILTSSARFIGFIDADNATPIATLDDAMALLGEGYDAVIASRRAPGARYEVEQSVARRGGGWVFRRLAHLTLPDISDTQCGFKFFNGPLVREIAENCRINGFAFDVEMLARIVRTGHTCVEVPIAWSDVPGSTFSARRDGFRAMADLLRIAISRGTG